MTVHYEAVTFCSPEAMSAVAHYIEHEYGYGYRIGLVASAWRVSIFEIAHSDGSRFNVIADCWGNIQRIPDNATRDEANAQLLAMREKASIP